MSVLNGLVKYQSSSEFFHNMGLPCMLEDIPSSLVSSVFSDGGSHETGEAFGGESSGFFNLESHGLHKAPSNQLSCRDFFHHKLHRLSKSCAEIRKFLSFLHHF